MAGLHFLAEMIRSGKPASGLSRQFEPVPQLLKNVRYKLGQTPLESAEVQAAIQDAEAVLTDKGRLLIRRSGTEPLIRVMAECEDAVLLAKTVDSIVETVNQAVAN